jgi:hypothetical protein
MTVQVDWFGGFVERLMHQLLIAVVHGGGSVLAEPRAS